MFPISNSKVVYWGRLGAVIFGAAIFNGAVAEGASEEALPSLVAIPEVSAERGAAMTQEELLDFAESALTAREKGLENFSHDVEEAITWPGKEAPAAAGVARTFQLKRDGSDYLYHLVYLTPPPGQEYYWLRKGQVMTFQRIARGNRPSETEIHADESDSIGNLEFGKMLGLTNGSIRRATLSQTLVEWRKRAAEGSPLPLWRTMVGLTPWLRQVDYGAKAPTVDAAWETVGESRMLRIAWAYDQSSEKQNWHVHETYWLDAGKGYLPTKLEYESTNKIYGRDFKRKQVVEESKEIDGLWVPMKVLVDGGPDYGTGPEVVEVFTVKAFTRNTVKAEDLKLDFPAGTKVDDLIGHKKWTEGVDGGAGVPGGQP